MRIVDLLSTDKIALGASAADKDGAIDLLVDLQDKSGCLTDRKAYKEAILAREAKSSEETDALPLCALRRGEAGLLRRITCSGTRLQRQPPQQ